MNEDQKFVLSIIRIVVIAICIITVCGILHINVENRDFIANGYEQDTIKGFNYWCWVKK